MYSNFFNIDENPFSNTPDPKYLFMSQRHKEALAHLIYGVEGGSGFVLLTGEVGCGKTTLSRYLAERLPENVELALCLNPRLSEIELLANICDDLGISVSGPGDSIKTLTSALNDHLLDLYAKGGSAVLIIDEAQNLSFELLEQVRLLTNLETTHNKLLQIILIGQPELKEFLDQPHLRQLSQRVTARYHLNPMTAEDTKNYIAHRAKVARLSTDVFLPGAVSEIYKYSRGIPRLINSICERCLLGAYALGKKTVDRALVRKATMEVLGISIRSRTGIVVSLATGAVAGLAGLVFLATNPLKMDLAPQITQSRSIVSLGENLTRLPELGRFLFPSGAEEDTAAVTPAVTTEESENSVADPDAEASIAEFLAQPDEVRSSHGFALSRLFALWRQGGAQGEDPTSCLEAANVGLACLGWEGGWGSLRRINLPSLIALRTSEGKSKFAMVRTLNGETATIELAGKPMKTTVSDISSFWTGGFLVLWRPPDVYRRTLLPGMIGDDVEWVRKRLGEIMEAPSDTPTPEIYDTDLLVRVNNFKRRHDLKTDGVVDHLSFILLSSTAGDGEVPVLAPPSVTSGLEQ